MATILNTKTMENLNDRAGPEPKMGFIVYLKLFILLGKTAVETAVLKIDVIS